MKQHGPGSLLEMTEAQASGMLDMVELAGELPKADTVEGAPEEKPASNLPDDTPKLAELNGAGLFTVEGVQKFGDLTEITGIGTASATAISEHLGIS